MGKLHRPDEPDQQLWSCAEQVERQHGQHACQHASTRIDALEAAGNREGAVIWRAILSRLEALRQVTAG